MRVLLIRPRSRMKTNCMPIGVGYVADAVRKARHEASIFDVWNHIPRIRKQIPRPAIRRKKIGREK